MRSVNNMIGFLLGVSFSIGVGILALNPLQADADDLPKGEQFDCKGGLCAKGKIGDGTGFVCHQSNQFPDQVVCVFFPEAVDPVVKEGIIEILEKAQKNGEKVAI